MKSSNRKRNRIRNLAVLTACFAVIVVLYRAVGSLAGYQGPFWGPDWEAMERNGDPVWYGAWPYIVAESRRAFLHANCLWIILYVVRRPFAICLGRAIVTVMLLFLLTHIVMTHFAIQYLNPTNGGVGWYQDLWEPITFEGWYIVTMGMYCFSRRAFEDR